MLSLTENTHRDKSLAGFSIYACGVRYVLTHSICLLRKRGIYLISNWRVATIYRVRAKREHIEWAKLTYRQKEKQEQEYYKGFLDAEIKEVDDDAPIIRMVPNTRERDDNNFIKPIEFPSINKDMIDEEFDIDINYKKVPMMDVGEKEDSNKNIENK